MYKEKVSRDLLKCFNESADNTNIAGEIETGIAKDPGNYELFSIEDVAKIIHQANKALCESQNDLSQKDYEEAEQWQKDSAIDGIKYFINNPNTPASALHQKWMDIKIADGWKYGEIKDAEKKTHPCILPFERMPRNQQAKDYMFIALCKALMPYIKE